MSEEDKLTKEEEATAGAASGVTSVPKAIEDTVGVLTAPNAVGGRTGTAPM